VDINFANLLLAMAAGLASVLSPCVLPVVPVIVAGADRKDRLRPLLVVSGLSSSFMIMGAISSLFGAYLIGRTRYIEIGGAAIIIIMGIMVLLDISFFKRFYRLSNIQVKGNGRFSGLVLGMALGVVWVPCIGPFLSSILTMVGTDGRLAQGILMLGFYSLGLAIPMLSVAYSSHLLQSRLRALAKHETVMRYVSGGILICFGVYSIAVGNIAF
jgi:cytochrome c-type biogenesis protein